LNPIEVNNLGKKFRLRHVKGQTLKATMIERILGRETREDFWALKNLNFTVKRGEVLGLIGSNGSGKTTLLSILGRTMVPTVGDLQVRGKVGSLLELGAGFHPDLTGRENIYLNASIMGIPRKVIEDKFPGIVEFSGLGHFIETPIKFYSSGMTVRLGFSVAVEVDPDILLIDEVLAVGDESFQKKSEKRIMEFKNSGKTIVVVSHDMKMIGKFCHRVLQLEAGEIVNQGGVEEVVEEYIRGRRISPGAGQPASSLKKEWGSRQAEIRTVRLSGREGETIETIGSGEDLTVEIGFFARTGIKDPVFGLAIHNEQYTLCFGSNTQMGNFPIPAIEGEGKLTLRLRRLPLLEGRYFLSLSLHSGDHLSNYHRQDFFYTFTVVSSRPGTGIADIPVEWELE